MVKDFYVDSSKRFMLSSTSKGNQIKWYDRGYFLKADSMGYESVSESLISELESYIIRWKEGVDFIDYRQCTIHEEEKIYEGCYSRNFLKNGESVISLYRILENSLTSHELSLLFKKKFGVDLKNEVVDICSSATRMDKAEIEKYLARIAYLDCITLNEDRHLNNIAFVKGLDEKYHAAPIFDNGLGLLSDLSDYPLEGTLSSMVKRVKARPFSKDFKKQVGYFTEEVLVIDIDSFEKSLQENGVLFKKKEFNRAKIILRSRLKQTHGIVWRSINERS